MKIIRKGTQIHAAFSDTASSRPVARYRYRQNGKDRDRDHQRRDQLHHADAHAEAAVNAERPPCFAFGKKKLMLAILEAKLAPAKPHSRDNHEDANGVEVSRTAKPSQTHGTIMIPVLNAVQRRPPNSGTIKA